MHRNVQIRLTSRSLQDPDQMSIKEQMHNQQELSVKSYTVLRQSRWRWPAILFMWQHLSTLVSSACSSCKAASSQRCLFSTLESLFYCLLWFHVCTSAAALISPIRLQNTCRDELLFISRYVEWKILSPCCYIINQSTNTWNGRLSSQPEPLSLLFLQNLWCNNKWSRTIHIICSTLRKMSAK